MARKDTGSEISIVLVFLPGRLGHRAEPGLLKLAIFLVVRIV
jgi:hypothetical protein